MREYEVKRKDDRQIVIVPLSRQERRRGYRIMKRREAPLSMKRARRQGRQLRKRKKE